MGRLRWPPESDSKRAGARTLYPLAGQEAFAPLNKADGAKADNGQLRNGAAQRLVEITASQTSTTRSSIVWVICGYTRVVAGLAP